MLVLDDFFEFSQDPPSIRIKGHRIGLEHVLEQYRGGKSAEEIARFYPSLRLEDVYAAILYYPLHRREVGAYLPEYEEIGRRMMTESDAHPSPVGQRMRDLWHERQEEKLRGADAVAR